MEGGLVLSQLMAGREGSRVDLEDQDANHPEANIAGRCPRKGSAGPEQDSQICVWGLSMSFSTMGKLGAQEDYTSLVEMS